MPKLPESLLALFAGRERAAVIYGDLTEMAAAHSRLWFAAAYLRTLVALGWRTPVALVVSYAASTWVALGAFPTLHWFLHRLFTTPPSKPRAATWHIATRAAHHMGTLAWQIPLGDSLIALWIILPFVAVRFGFRDRVTQLASALFVLTLPYFSLQTAGVTIAGLAASCILLFAFALRAWRRPMAILAATIAPVAAAIFLTAKVLSVFASRGYSVYSPQLQCFLAFYRGAELCTAAIVCLFLYNRLLHAGSRHIAQGANHA